MFALVQVIISITLFGMVLVRAIIYPDSPTNALPTYLCLGMSLVVCCYRAAVSFFHAQRQTLHYYPASLSTNQMCHPFPHLKSSTLRLSHLPHPPQVWSRAKFQTRRMVEACDKVWESSVASSGRAQDQLAMLERVVSDLEMAIPTGTVARQFNLRVYFAKHEPSLDTTSAFDGSPARRRRSSVLATLAKMIKSPFVTDTGSAARNGADCDVDRLALDGEGHVQGISEILVGTDLAQGEGLLKFESIEALIAR